MIRLGTVKTTTMDAFVTRHKRRKLRTPPPSLPLPPSLPQTEALVEGGREDDRVGETQTASTEPDDDGDDESTEVKLAMLASLLEGTGSMDQDAVLDLLLAYDGSVEAAAAAVQSGQWRPETPSKNAWKTGSGVVGQQTSLRSLLHAGTMTGAPATTLLSKRGRTLSLYDPADVDAHTPCTLVHNFLPPEMANDLLREMLAEAKTFGPPYRFKLFDQVVSSPHTSRLYLASSSEAAAAATAAEDSGDSLDAEARNTDPFELTTETHDGYRYNGSRLPDVRAITPHMARVRPLVEEAVNRAIQQRITTHYPGGHKLRYQSPGRWQPNAAFVNCYDGGQQSVGWHSDHLTYLGPRAVIGSLSLGVAREFRVRRIVPQAAGSKNDEAKSKRASKGDDAAGQISIHLPHNSLLIMHAEMQEEWKHCVTPAASIDPHPVAGGKRINITYRDYRAQFHPQHTPRCRCGIASILRVVQRKKENHGRYFWTCHAGNIPDREGCTFFQWAEFDDDGNPPWSQTTGNGRDMSSAEKKIQ